MTTDFVFYFATRMASSGCLAADVAKMLACVARLLIGDLLSSLRLVAADIVGGGGERGRGGERVAASSSALGAFASDDFAKNDVILA